MTAPDLPAAEESRALLELGAGQCLTSEVFDHLRAALDREAEALALATKNWDGWCAEVIERKRIEAERDAARAEAARLRRLALKALASGLPDIVAEAARAALASEPGA